MNASVTANIAPHRKTSRMAISSLAPDQVVVRGFHGDRIAGRHLTEVPAERPHDAGQQQGGRAADGLPAATEAVTRHEPATLDVALSAIR